MEKFSQKTVLILAGLMFLISQSLGLPVKVNDDDKVPPPIQAEIWNDVPEENANEKLTIDEMLRKANKNMDSNIVSDSNEPEVYLTEYDIALTKEQYEALHNTGPQKRTAALRDESTRWINKTVRFKYEADTFDSPGLVMFVLGIAEIKHYSCLDFTFKTPNTTVDKYWVHIINGTGCYSHIGQIGHQTLSLGNGCMVRYIIIHELLHTIGLYHEQNRPDRDDYVTINFDNIETGREKNFEKKLEAEINTFGFPYDYLSIMHYGKTAFSKNKENTITTKDSAYQDVIGQKVGMSPRDVRILNIMYNCSDHCTKTDADCPSNGFLGKDCKCWCAMQTDDYPVEYCSDEDKTKYGSLKFVPPF